MLTLKKSIMSKNLNNLKTFFLNNYTIFTFILYSIIFFLLLPYYKHQINPDGISLINVARKYMAGNFYDAINGYWSPLISWLLIPFLYIFKNPILSFKMLSYFIGIFSIFFFCTFIRKLEIDDTRSRFFTILILPLITVYYSISVITSDFLISTLYLFLLSIIMEKNIFEKRFSYILIGITGFLLYLAKTYGFFFFNSFMLLFLIYFILKKRKKNIVLKNIIVSLLFMNLLSLSWISLISNKYGYLTVGTTGKYNYSILNPDTTSVKNIYQKPLCIPDEMSTSFWDDPSFVEHPAISFHTIKSNFNYYIKITIQHLLTIFKLMLSFSLFFPFIILWAFFLLKKEKRKITIISVAMILSFIGYMMAAITRRFIFVNFYLLAALFFLIFKNLKLKNDILKISIFILVSFSFMVMPFRELKDNLNSNLNEFLLSERLKEFRLNGNVASNKNRKLLTTLSFYLGLKYYGTFYDNYTEDSFNDLLEKKRIFYYFYFGKSPQFLNSYEILYDTVYGEDSLRIFIVDEKR